MHQENLNSYEYLVKKHQGLVYHIVNKFHVSSFDRDDLIQAGMLGLLEAIKKYDISFNTKFSTFAVPYILGNIKKEYYIHNSVISNMYYINLINKVQNEQEDLSVNELASKYKTTKENIVIALNFSNKITYLSEEDLERISDNKKSEVDLTILNKEEKLIYHLSVNMKLTQKELADKMNMSQSSISRKLKKIMKKLYWV